MHRQVYFNLSRAIYSALICVCLLIGWVSVLKLRFVVRGSGVLIAMLDNRPFNPPEDQRSSVKISSSLQRHQSEPLSLRTNLSAEFPPAPAKNSSVDPHGCERVCGQVKIPYPFGLSAQCARGSFYLLSCIQSNSSTLAEQNLQDPGGPWPFLPINAIDSFQVINIDSSGTLIINATTIKAMSTPPSEGGTCGVLGNPRVDAANASLQIDADGPYAISSSNVFAVIGCGAAGAYSLLGPLEALGVSNDISQALGPISCLDNSSFAEYPFCNSYNCLALSIRAATGIYMTVASGGYNYSGQESVCSFGTVLYPPSYSTWDSGLVGVGQYGLQLVWALMDYDNCSEAQSHPPYACTANFSTCKDFHQLIAYNIPLVGYLCECIVGYEGDGYKNGSGCSDIDECANATFNNCSKDATCTNNPGSYSCLCKHGFKGDGFRNGTDCTRPRSHALIAGISSAVGIFLIINVMLIWYLIKRWQNGPYEFQRSNASFQNALMEMQMQDGAKSCKLYSLKELNLATKSFSMENMIGKGGFGMVFRGVLADSTMVAIKKPKNDVCSSHDDIKQFINEVTILSQVNHRNLVRLLGCCLETKIPLLVYEYISNGNLFDCLHPKEKDCVELQWGKRLEIAVGAAEALKYLHFGTSPPIYHRDVKTANILLDEKYTAKVADFGLSRFVPIEATHVSTLLRGTLGYLDPEFFDNFQISDKSDVYSFGVVLIELITAEKAVDLSRDDEDQNLVIRFFEFMKEARLEDMIDVSLDASSDPDMLHSISKVAEVALKCVQRSRKQRPSMKLVADELELVKKSYKGSTSPTSFESISDQCSIPLKRGMSDSSMDYAFNSCHAFDFHSYTSSISYKNSSSSSSGIELRQQ